MSKRRELMCENCVCSFFSTEAAIGTCGRVGAQHWLITFSLEVYWISWLSAHPVASPGWDVQNRAQKRQKASQFSSGPGQTIHWGSYSCTYYFKTIGLFCNKFKAASALSSPRSKTELIPGCKDCACWPELFCFGTSPKWYYWFSASCSKCLAQLLNVWSPFMLGRKCDCRSPIHSRTERAWKPFTIKKKKSTSFGNETFYFISLCF